MKFLVYAYFLALKVDGWPKPENAGLQITVGHRKMSDQIWQMSEQK
jgi:hypothetical protein